MEKGRKKFGNLVNFPCFVGANALRKLLKQTTGIGHDQKYRNFIKHGDYETALKEFKSVSPVDVRTTTTDRGVSLLYLLNRSRNNVF